MSKNIVCAIYYHPEAYPPTLNAIDELSKIYDKVFLLYQPHLKNSWSFPANVELIQNGEHITVQQQAQLTIIKKFLLFFRFTSKLLKLCFVNKPHTILLYDAFPLLSYHIVKGLFKKPKVIWYHNHDVFEQQPSKFTLAWFAEKVEKKAFSYLDLFSLPSAERQKFFDLGKFKGKLLVIPNYPAKKLYNKFYTEKNISDKVILIYQGRISEGHGLEMIASLLNNTVNGVKLQLNLKGISSDDFQEKIVNIATRHNVSDKLNFLGMTPYTDVPIEGNKAHIGIGIFTKSDKMNTTLGTASNKIYEYAAMGLPVLYKDDSNFNAYLDKFAWAIKCNVNEDSILAGIQYIMNNYTVLRDQARNDFNNDLNFESYFEPAIIFLSEQ